MFVYSIILTYFAQNDLSTGASASPSIFSLLPRISSVNIGVLHIDNLPNKVYVYVNNSKSFAEFIKIDVHQLMFLPWCLLTTLQDSVGVKCPFSWLY